MATGELLDIEIGTPARPRIALAASAEAARAVASALDAEPWDLVALPDHIVLAELSRRAPPDLILLDATLPGPEGLSATEVSIAVAPEVPVVAFGSAKAVAGAVRQGALGGFVWPSPRDAVVCVVRAALRVTAGHYARACGRVGRREPDPRFDRSYRLWSTGLAHDLNNLLTAISGHAALLRERVEGDKALRPSVTALESAADQAIALSRQFLLAGRVPEVASLHVDLNCVVAGIGQVWGPLLGPDVALRVVRASFPLVARVRPGQLERALANLLVNARDALPGGGTVDLEVGPADGDEVAGLPPILGPESTWARVQVRDSGTGMEPAVHHRLFQPFESTKDGPNRGLGLAIVRSIARDLGGDVRLGSAPGHGCCIGLFLPVLRSPSEEYAPCPSQPT